MFSKIKRKIVSYVELRLNTRMFLINLVCLGGIFVLGINIFRVMSLGYQRHRLIMEASRELEEAKLAQLQLEGDLDWYSSLEYIEMQSRDFLNLGSGQESILVLPDGVRETMQEDLEKDLQEGYFVEPSIYRWIDLIL